MAETTEVPEKLYQNAEILESYAVEIRYPDNWYEPTMNEAVEGYNISLNFKEYILKRLIIH